MKTVKRHHQASSITRAGARLRAGQHILKQMFKGAVIRPGTTLTIPRYKPGSAMAARRVWLVYTNYPDANSDTAIRSAHVIAVCQRTGKILYAGSVGDEG